MKKATWKPVPDRTINFFEKHNIQLSIVNIVNTNKDPFSFLINRCGGIVHSLLLLYEQDLHRKLSVKEKMFLKTKLNEFYENPPRIDQIKIWVWGSLESSGINFYDFSHIIDLPKFLYPVNISTHYKFIHNSLPYFQDKEKEYTKKTISFALYEKLGTLFKTKDNLKHHKDARLLYDILRDVSGYICSDDIPPTPQTIHEKISRLYSLNCRDVNIK